jgi:peptidoglycan-associated lipoprotein
MHGTRLLPFVVAALVAACASVEEQKSATTAPQTFGTASGDTPSVRPIDRQGVAVAPTGPGSSTAAARMGAPTKGSVYFEYDRDDIKPEFRGVVEEHAKYLRQNTAARVRIEGNADERGSREYNIALGQRRAEAVMKALGLLGVPASRMEAISYGEEKPRRTGHDEPSWAENRRDDVVLEAGR